MTDDRHSHVERFDIGGRAGITLRSAGDMGPSSVRWVPARSIVLRELRKSPTENGSAVSDEAELALLVLPQTHSRVVRVVDSSWLDRPLPEGDGMVTSDPAVILGVTVGDCLPIFLRDRTTGARALVHSGRRGTGIAAVAVDVLESHLGSRPEEIEAYIGPGICGGCYEVGEEVYRRFLDRWGPDCVRSTGDSHFVDLKAANQLLLHRAGVERVRSSPGCTLESRAYSSYRRDGAGFARMLAFFAD